MDWAVYLYLLCASIFALFREDRSRGNIWLIHSPSLGHMFLLWFYIGDFDFFILLIIVVAK